MINLHAIYYRNIGPFEGKECSLLFDQGKFLIKAPIGSGKSFLFFDGPTYALYRTANRNMLNIQSKEGEISLIFSEGEQYYLVKRILKPGKSKDSCSSQLFSITFPTRPEGATPYDIGHRPMAGEGEEVVQRDTNLIADLTANPQRQVEEVVMKNETDLQQTLDQLLPPKSVFLSTMFLLQDAENIFEMQPADRLTVLKNVFGLLGIDEAKEQVQDKKRELSYKLKALQDHSQQDAKLRKRLRELHNNYLTLSSCHCEDGSGIGRSSLEHIEPFCSEIEPFLDQLTLNDFTLNGLDIQLFLSLQEQLQAKEKDLLAKQTIKDHLAKQIADHNNQITKREQEKKKLIADIAHLEKQIAGIDQAQIDKLKQEKAQLYEQQTALETLPIPVTFDNQPYTTLSDLYTLIQTLKERGKDLANQVQLAEQQLKALQRETELEAKNQQMKAEQLEQAKKRLTDFEISINEQATFSCEKIGTNCPFITVINKQHFDQLEKQKSALCEEIQRLENTQRKDDGLPRPSAEAVTNITAIAFDLGGVLLKENDFPLSKTEQILEKQFGNLNTNEAYYQWAMKETGLPKAELEHLVEYIIQNIYELRDTNIFEKLPKVKLAIATNHLSAIHTRLQPFQDHFDYVLVSADAEVQKPEPAFYKKLIEGLNEKPENIFFIDDSPENIEGAKAVGLQTLHYQRGQDLAEKINKFFIHNSQKFSDLILRNSSQITAIKTFLTDVDYKSQEDKYAQKEALQKQIHEKDQIIMSLETETQKLQDYQQQKTASQTSLQTLDQQIQEMQAKTQKIKAESEHIDQQLCEHHAEQLKTQLQTIANILQIIHDIEQLIIDATATKNLVKDLQHQEKLLTNLYTILSKEILLIALDEYLPVLSEIINSFLTQVVDYQISMKIMETAEKLELEAKIYDEKGEREVKSLSGGQRTILKLVRMLAISSYLNTPLLFLDETINNLDIDTIGKVSEMLNNFVKHRTMKFYTVTHNINIQEMDIWDSVIEIGKGFRFS